MNIHGIILAAGASKRMGALKQLLPLGEKPMLEHVIHLALSEGFLEVFTVIGQDAERIRKRILIDDPRLNWVINEHYYLGQSTSVKVGIRKIDQSELNVMIFLGDLPFVSTATIHTIYQAGYKQLKESKNSFIIQPTYKGVPGHPVFFGNTPKNFFAALKGDKGARSLMEKPHLHLKFAVKDKGIILDLDTPEEYEVGKLFFKYI